MDLTNKQWLKKPVMRRQMAKTFKTILNSNESRKLDRDSEQSTYVKEDILPNTAD